MINDAGQAVAAIQDLMFSSEGRSLPDDIQEKIQQWLKPTDIKTGTSFTYKMAYFAELIYARKDEIKSKKALELAASIASFCIPIPVDTLGGTRAYQISLALRRDAEEQAPKGTSWPKKEDDPNPREDFVQ